MVQDTGRHGETGPEEKRAVGARMGMGIGIGVVAVSAALGFLFPPLWVVTSFGLAYLVYAAVARKKG